jgi:Cu/Ag efflux protein CusF
MDREISGILEENGGVIMRGLRVFTVAVIAFFVSTVISRADEFRGKITKVDPTKKEVVVEGRGSGRGLALSFAVNSETRIQMGREPAKLEDLQAGDRVRLLFENRNNQRIALAINDLSLRRLLPPADAGAGNAPPPPPAVPQAPAEQAPAGPNTVTGRLIRVGVTEREIVIVTPAAQGGKEAETTLLVPSDVKITNDQKTLKFEELKTGEQVTIRTEKRDGHLVAASIQSGGQTTAAMPSQQNNPQNNPSDNRRIEKLRQALKVADWILQQLDQQRDEPK